MSAADAPVSYACESCGKLSGYLSEVANARGEAFRVCADCRVNYTGRRLDYYFSEREVRA